MSKPAQSQIAILVVEDDPGDLGLIQAYLRLAGLRRGGDRGSVATASTLVDGAALAVSVAPDVVLLDLSLPDSAGLATVQVMSSVVPDVPVIVLTGQDDHQLAEAALEAGAQDYLVKGQFDHDALGRAIRHALVRQKLESRLRLFEAALNSAANGILVTDVNSRIEWVNPAFTRMTGLTLDEVVGRTTSEMLNSGKQDAAFYQRMWETILDGRVWSGELINRRKDGSLYDEALTISPVTDVNGRIRHFVAIKQDISERKAAEERVQHLAHHDQLTDLPNRVLLTDRLFQALAQARRERSTLALMFLDLDQFKPVNDTLGHDVGDLLLKEVALRLQNCVPRESDTISRLGGDEFVILLAQIDKAVDAVLVGGKILAALNRPFSIGPHQIVVSASIGIAVYPQHGEDANSLLKNADLAMYLAKKAGRNCYRFFREITDTARA
ncbi:diguanylate cyclase domain-containing protein [Accumulibacter sp.]|uniref:diguanylate cyclase domain-containing protein n=1 Tax=Accumulibacter sp. TaxID=2053492 RepID=UPI0025CD176D|nr:diguanylate cyclase [Accumulibacter sp.]MCM8596963.1 diguanylate cyclase [Accumulibacter sp.]MCM8624457.1 diguanylate cyclase [Accumulibacter sp.]MDS4051112.1 diguanylate cyclase [Accumulibacter sp.]